MAEVRKSASLPASADEVWALVGDYNGLPAWLPGIEHSVLEDDGRVRRLTLEDGAGEVVEELDEHDPAGRTYSYRIVESKLPIRDYSSTMVVRESAGGSELEWSGAFEPVGASEEEAVGIIGGIYEAGLSSLRARFGG